MKVAVGLAAGERRARHFSYIFLEIKKSMSRSSVSSPNSKPSAHISDADGRDFIIDVTPDGHPSEPEDSHQSERTVIIGVGIRRQWWKTAARKRQPSKMRPL